MTIIAAHKDPKTGDVWIGSDSRGLIDDFIWPEKRHKIIRCGGWAIAVAGSAMNARVVRGKRDEIAACHEVSEIADILLADFKARDYASKTGDRSGPVSYGQEFIVANHAGVHGIFVDGTVAPAPFVAMGSGCPYAYGVWYAMRTYLPSLSGKNIVEAAIDAAIAFDSGCGGEVVVEQVR